jgi:acetyl-CoA carboxylase biotin carboxyl carrier protein
MSEVLPALQFDLETVRQVAALLRDSELGEICIETTSEDAPPARLLLRRAASTPLAYAPAMAPPDTAALLDERHASDASEDASTPSVPTTNITAPSVGVFRPAAVAVKAGDEIKAGQVLGVVESLRVPNDIVATVGGRVRELGAQDGQGVEYGQVLFVIEEIE